MNNERDSIPVRPDSEPPDLPTGSGSRSSRPSLGAAAIVCGVIGLIPVLGIPSAILAIILGGISLRRTLPGTRKRKVASVGLGLGVTTLVLQVIFFALFGTYGDASARAACSDFNYFGRRADQMTNGELHDHLQDIARTAEASETPGIREAARRMLSTMEAFEIDAFEGAVDDMRDACALVDVA